MKSTPSGTMSQKKSRSGISEPVLVRLPDELLKALDALRRAEDDPPTRPAMIRRILTEWMEQQGPKGASSDRDD
jgi:metal-responsive CopG/Arc/MetJ family transcriptional regulator